MRAHAIDLYLTHQMSTLLMTQPSDGGFVDIQQQRVAIPLGWGGPLGEVHSQNIGSLLSSLNPTLCRPQTSPLSPPLTPTTPGVGGQGLDATTIQQVLEECKRYQSHLNWHVCFGRKSTVGSSNLHHGSRQDSLHFSTSYSCLSTTASTTAAASTKAAVASTASTATSSSQANDASYLEDGAWDLINDFVYGFTD
ncbi:hypothetical protein BDF14DRAFT_355379 [Spinellus fusiger]|nr:hypothetical protein BDF14DRAFT_355379 [Spinellus fusiger]